jgi:hypothetical protein
MNCQLGEKTNSAMGVTYLTESMITPKPGISFSEVLHLLSSGEELHALQS